MEPACLIMSLLCKALDAGFIKNLKSRNNGELFGKFLILCI
jgi:hypothetical protein